MKTIKIFTLFLLLTATFSNKIYTQQTLATHTRGKLWETINNDGFIGSEGAWDYNEVTGIGFYPGFSGFTFPNNEQLANESGKITDANFHNFRSGPWIMVKGGLYPQPPDYAPKPQDYIFYHSSMTVGSEQGLLPSRPPIVTRKNFVGTEGFNPLLPEEINTVSFPTATGITVRQTSMEWSFPGYNSFIIYDYVFKNTGDMAIPPLNKTIHVSQTLNEVWFAFHSGISVSTKGTLNFHYNPNSFISSAAPAGGFGGYHHQGSDYYYVENQGADGKGLFYYSRDYNGGREPVPWDDYAIKNGWQDLLKIKPDWLPELQDPACFGFAYLYRTPPPGGPSDPLDADPNFFSVHNDEGDNFNGKALDINEFFGPGRWQLSEIYNFMKHSYLRPNDGKIYAWSTGSFGPYTLAPGDSVRLIVAEIAGQMDMNQVIIGDPNHWYPDSSVADIHRNLDAVRRAISWGIGAKVDGMDLAADVPEAPPAPNCNAATQSRGSDTAIIAVQWDKLAENAMITDGSQQVFYDGSADLSGYRIYRSIDQRGAWNLVIDIPRSQLANYWKQSLNRYEYLDKNLQFGQEFYYYVQAYNSKPKLWTSANGTKVNDLGELASADYNRTDLVNARPGPVSLTKGWNVFVAPNPYIEGDATHSFGQPTPRKIEFRNLPEKATIKIFSLSGDLIKTLQHGPDSNGNLFGSISWDQTSNSGLLVAPGVYIYVVQSETEGYVGSKFTGKLMIIR